MKQVRPSTFSDAMPLDLRGRRLPMTLLRLDVRDAFLRLAADIHCTGLSGRQAAMLLHVRLGRYREGAWRRDQILDAVPPRLAGRIDGLMWCVLKCRDHVPSVRLIRLVLAR
jgi:hypothetical protein